MTIPLATQLAASPPVTYNKPIPSTYAQKYKPTHPGLFRVRLGNTSAKASQDEEDSFDSCLVAEKDISPNTILTQLTNISIAPAKAYSSVQHGVSLSDHFELNSDLLFVNHSCTPNVAFDLSSSSPSGWNLKSLSKPIKKDEMLTFFYPSTEWEMDRGFQCACGESNCLGYVSGAKDLSRDTLKKQEFINPHIWEMKSSQGKNGVVNGDSEEKQ